MAWILELKWPNFSDTHVYAHIFAQIPVKPLFSHLHKAGFFVMKIICKLVYNKFNEQCMKKSTFCEIKYMNRLCFFLKTFQFLFM